MAWYVTLRENGDVEKIWTCQAGVTGKLILGPFEKVPSKKEIKKAVRKWRADKIPVFASDRMLGFSHDDLRTPAPNQQPCVVTI